MQSMSRNAAAAFAVALALCVLGLAGPGGPPSALAQGGVPNPMLTPNPMMPSPGQPMSPMSVAPMQPLGGLAGQPETGVVRDPEFDNLPVSAGMEDTFYACTACHSTQTFAQMRLTDERWAYLWDWMIDEQGMPDYGPELRETILSYLTEHFSSER